MQVVVPCFFTHSFPFDKLYYISQKNTINTTNISTIVDDINVFETQFQTKIEELSKQLIAYTENYDDKRFVIPPLLIDFDQEERNTEIQRGETIFDQVRESILRIENIVKLHNFIENIMDEFVKGMKELKLNIHSQRKNLIEINNEILVNLNKLKMH